MAAAASRPPEPLPAPPAPPALPRSAWIVSAPYDVVFFVASVAVPLLFWWAFSFGWMTGVAVYASFQLLFNMPHNVQTWTMSIFDRADRAKNGRRYVVAFAVIVAIFAGTKLASPDGAYPWVQTALLYWGYYHLVRQHYGFQRLYERRMVTLGAPPSPLESKLYARFLDVVSYAPLLVRFRDPELMTVRIQGRAIWTWHPPLPNALLYVVLGVYVATIGAAVVHHVVAYARGRRHMGARALLLASVTLAFGISGLAIRDLIVASVVVTAYHNLQYLGLTLFHNRTRAAIAEREGVAFGDNLPIDWLRRGRWLPYALMTFGYGVLVILPRVMFLTVGAAELPLFIVIAMHYYVDARIWRFGDYPALARYLKLKP